MGMTIDDEVKQKLLNSLAEEPTMVLSTAYAYAKNFVMYGEDITKAWTTAVQQASIVEKVSLNAWAQAHETFRREYETRLKADLVDMLEDLKQDIISEAYGIETDCSDYVVNVADIDKVIQEKINKLKEQT
jgi:hypothetical protein